MGSLEEVILNHPEDLLVPNEALVKSSLAAVKASLDPVARDYSIFEAVHVDGLDADQVWAQTQMIVDGAIEKLLGDVIPKMSKKRPVGDAISDEELDESDGWGVADSDLQVELEDQGDDVAETGSDMESIDEGVDDYQHSDGFEELEEGADHGAMDEPSGQRDEDEESSDDKNELDEGLFRLKEFQQQVLDLEKEPEMDNDDGIDYFGDNLAESEDESDVDYRFEDFFDAPKSSKSKAAKKASKGRVGNDNDVEEWSGLGFESDEENFDQAMSSVKKDLFDDEEEKLGGVKGEENLSTFERQQREIVRQIRELEAENIGEKEWAVRGEVVAKDRPLDSLVTTDLEFERNSKPVPVITQDATDTLEDLIRRRIKNSDFDDIPRRLPDSLPEFKRSKFTDVSETKSQKSLAELYEDDYARSRDPAYKDAEDEKMSATHKEIEGLYASLSRKLDALCSWNYTPKAPKPSVNVVVNAPAVAMEEAQPTSMATESQLAPQEVYQPQATSRREVTGTDGLPIAKAEMTREERKRERRRQKAKRAKVTHEREERERAKAQQKVGSKADVLQTLKKSGNVTVIGKKGEKRDLKGNLKLDKIRAGADLKL
jgi:U3 small nucleolar RNA-associated protein MPP10